MGPFGYWGTGLGDRDNFKFFAAGFQFGKVLSPVVHASFLSGQFELAGNIMPIWQAYTPAPRLQLYECVAPGGELIPCDQPVGGGTFTGVSLTPVIFRWNFLTRSQRIQPWFQGAGGLIYTTHKFPPDVLVPHGTPGRHVRVEFFAAGRDRCALVHRFGTFDRSGRECGPYLVGIAGRSQSRGECEPAGAGGIHMLEIKKGKLSVFSCQLQVVS